MILRRIPYQIAIRPFQTPYFREIALAMKDRTKITPAVKKFTEYLKYIERLILGEEKAFCKLYVQYKPRLFKFAIALLKSQNVAEDICQDIFFNIWENRYFLKCGTSFSSFLFSMARNRIINYLRDESCHKRILESLYEQAIDFDNSTKNTILANDLGEHMKHAVKLLSNRQREVFELSRHHMLTNKEIAEQLNISISTVQDHLSASLKIIRTYFKKEGLLHTSQIIFFQILFQF